MTLFNRALARAVKNRQNATMKNAIRAGMALLLLSSTACQSFYLLDQGIKNLDILEGAIEIESNGEPHVDGVDLNDEETEKLALIGQIRQFAAEELGLAVGNAYTSFYEVPDDAISYAVTAAHPLALVPYQWRFPFVGRVAYKGYFERADAEAEARRLHDEGWDIHISPVAAFSTLGWFDDPVLSTMLEYSAGGLADVIIHELAHRTVYFKNATDVNESMATLVGRHGTRLFLRKRYGDNSEQLQQYERNLRLNDFRSAILSRLRNDLDALYRSQFDADRKLLRKKELFAHASELLFPQAEHPESVLPPSNANIISRKQYSDHVELFAQVLDIFGGETRKFMAFLKELPDSDDPLPEIRKLLGLDESGQRT